MSVSRTLSKLGLSLNVSAYLRIDHCCLAAYEDKYRIVFDADSDRENGRACYGNHVSQSGRLYDGAATESRVPPMIMSFIFAIVLVSEKAGPGSWYVLDLSSYSQTLD